MYSRADIPTIPIPDTIFQKYKEASKKMGEENKGDRTRDGGKHRDLKGCIGQWAVGEYLKTKWDKWNWIYNEPYVENQHGDEFDIKFCGEIWDVKCRSWWNEQYFGNIGILMGEHEKTEAKHPDYYIFVTVDKDYKNAYILGGKTYHKLWDELLEIEDPSKLPFPAEGYFKSRTLTPIKKVILRV